MIDTHSHYLFGVDDGAEDIEMSMVMIRMAIDEGITGAVVTPHYYLPKYDNLNVQKHFDLLKARLAEEAVAFDLYLGNELHLDEEGVTDYLNGEVNALNQSAYLLVELPFQRMYPFHLDLIHQLQVSGSEIILAHVDRYRYLCENLDLLEDLRNRGVFFQMNAKSLTDRSTKKIALKLIQRGYVDIVATDTHRSNKRPPKMAEAYGVVAKKYGQAYARGLFVENPKAVIENRAIISGRPVLQKGGWMAKLNLGKFKR